MPTGTHFRFPIMANKLLYIVFQVDANVFLVDWGRGASNANYLQVASNTRVVGILIAK